MVAQKDLTNNPFKIFEVGVVNPNHIRTDNFQLLQTNTSRCLLPLLTMQEPIPFFAVTNVQKDLEILNCVFKLCQI